MLNLFVSRSRFFQQNHTQLPRVLFCLTTQAEVKAPLEKLLSMLLFMPHRQKSILIFLTFKHYIQRNIQHLNNFITCLGRLMSFIFLFNFDVVKYIQSPFLYIVYVWKSGTKTSFELFHKKWNVLGTCCPKNHCENMMIPNQNKY